MHEGKHGIIDEWDGRPELFAEGEDGAGATSLKKGCIVMKKNNYLKVTYSHRNSEMEGIGAINFTKRGSEARVTPAFGKTIAETDLRQIKFLRKKV